MISWKITTHTSSQQRDTHKNDKQNSGNKTDHGILGALCTGRSSLAKSKAVITPFGVKSFTQRISLEAVVQFQQGALIHRDQATPWSVYISNQRNDHRDEKWKQKSR